AAGEEPTRHRARADRLGRAARAGHDGLREAETGLGEHVDLVNELAGSVPAPRRVGAGGHSHACLGHETDRFDALVERAARGVELGDEVDGEAPLALTGVPEPLDAGL